MDLIEEKALSSGLFWAELDVTKTTSLGTDITGKHRKLKVKKGKVIQAIYLHANPGDVLIIISSLPTLVLHISGLGPVSKAWHPATGFLGFEVLYILGKVPVRYLFNKWILKLVWN